MNDKIEPLLKQYPLLEKILVVYCHEQPLSITVNGKVATICIHVENQEEFKTFIKEIFPTLECEFVQEINRVGDGGPLPKQDYVNEYFLL